MKKRFLLFAAFAGFAAQAQAQVTVTPEFGFLLNKFSGYTTSNGMRTSMNYDWRMGARGGVMVDIPIGDKGFSIEPGIFYNSKNTKLVESNDMYSTDLDINFNNAELPINLKYSWSVGEYSGKLFVLLSPYVSYSFSGRQKGSLSIKYPIEQNSTVDKEIDFSSGSTQQYKPLDYGAYLGFGYQFQMGLQLKMIYGTSLGNISVVPDARLRSGGMFGVSIGYVLGRRIPGRFY